MHICLLFCILALTIPAFGDADGIQPKQGGKYACAPTRPLPVLNKPIMQGVTYTDNDTTKNSGEFDNQYVRKILLRGVIKDRNCVPVANATIEIWQSDEYGKNRYNTFSYSFLDRYNLNYDQYSKFLGIATATSNNDGYFEFITVLPNSKMRKARLGRYNVAVWHRDFPMLETQLSIKDNKTRFHSQMIAYRNFAADDAFVLPTYDFEVILNGENRYKSY